MAKVFCKDQKPASLVGQSTKLQSEVRGTQDQLASFVEKTLKLDDEIHDSKCRTVFECSVVRKPTAESGAYNHS